MDKKKILVVDDEIDFLELMKIKLEANNYNVVTANNGKEALKKVKSEKPDAVLLDMLPQVPEELPRKVPPEIQYRFFAALLVEELKEFTVSYYEIGARYHKTCPIYSVIRDCPNILV